VCSDTCIGKTFIDNTLNDQIKSCIESSVISKLPSGNHRDIALQMQIRSDWQLHKNTDFPSMIVSELTSLISGVVENMELFPDMYNHFNLGNRYKINILDMWYSRCVSDKSTTDPHIHDRGINNFSFVLYNNLPSGKSSLTFSDYLMNWKKRIIVREGDVLVFPSSLIHWSFDTEVDRAMIAGNFVLEPYTNE
jgi:hypothetical protein